MAVVRGLWRVLVGVKDMLVLALLLMFFILLWAGLHGRAPLTVPSGSALVLGLDGAIVDQASERSPLQLASGSDIGEEIQARDIIRAIDHAAKDDRIKVMALDLDTFLGAGQANLQSIGEALQRFRATKKKVYAYATAYTDDGYYLAAHADQVWINPLGGVLITGPGGANLYFGKALQKLDIDVNVFRVGTYKAAVEPFTRSESSPEAKAAEQALVDSLWNSYASDVAAARKGADVKAYLAALPARLAQAGGDQSKAALDAKLVDRIGTKAEFAAAIAKEVGDGDFKDFGHFNGIALDQYLTATAPLAKTGPAVGVVYVSGDIVDGEAPRGTAGGTTIARAIADAVDDDDIKALVVRIDSPGGSVLASEEIRQALIEAKDAGLPIVASFGPVAASGGYWVSTAADKVFAQPSTITGSIGVFAIIPSFNRALKEINVGADGVKSTPYSGEPDVVRGLSPETKAILQAGVEDVYRRFTGLVATARKLPQARVDEIGQGRVWAGATALQLKLVDEQGGLDKAVAAAAKLAKLPADVRTVDVEKKPSRLAAFLAETMGAADSEEGASAKVRDPFAKLVMASRVRLLAGLGSAAAMANGPTMQAACVECAALGTPKVAAARETQGWLTRLAAWLPGR
jgi:protease-4